jgi:hypothetical protein
MQPFTDGDTDADGIPNSWMVQHFGHPTALAADHSRAQDDPDSDALSNLQEFLAGTDPLDSRSCLRLRPAGVNTVTGRPEFAFDAVAGIGYTLQYCDNIALGLWRWLRDVPPALIDREVHVEDLAVATSPIRLYRVVTPIQPSSTVDSDNDGIPDLWMIQNFGHPTGTVADYSRAQDDPDSDDMSNLQEYLAGTDPLDPQSCLRLFAQVLSGTGQVQLSFTAVAGVGYTVQYSEGLASGVWHKLTDLPPQTSTRIAVLNDPGIWSSPGRFYRIVTPVQP